MKTVVIFAIIVVSLTACTDTPEEKTNRYNESAYWFSNTTQKMTYARDYRTGICFARGYNNRKSLATVECTEEVLSLINESNPNGNYE